MMFEEKIERGLKSIDIFLENADDVTLEFLGMTSQQRDTLVLCDCEILPTHKLNFMAVSYNKIENYAAIYYNPEIKNPTQETTTKALCHEAAHIFQYLRTNEPITQAALSKTNRFMQSNLARYAAIGLMILAEETLEPDYIQNITKGVLAGLTIAASTLNQQLEHNADDFADKLMPEVNYEQMMSDYLSNMPDVLSLRQLGFKLLNPLSKSIIGPLIYSGVTHPSEYTRHKNSYERCEKYGLTKAALGIPSLML